MGLPSASIVMPFIIPASEALTPVANSPITSAAAPIVIFIYTVVFVTGRERAVGGETFFVGLEFN